jgi:hypothetical protein
VNVQMICVNSVTFTLEPVIITGGPTSIFFFLSQNAFISRVGGRGRKLHNILLHEHDSAERKEIR